jgi:hypothetical protein
MKKKSILETPKLKELKKRKRKVIRNRIIFFAIIFVLLLVGLAFLSYWHEINIQDIQIEGNKIIDKQDIKKVAQENIEGKYFWIFPKTNSFIYPVKKIEENLSEKYKRLKDIKIDVDANDLKTLWISVSEYDGKYLWCGDKIIDSFVDQQCYFLDADGYIFDKAPYFSGEVYFKFFGNAVSDLTNPVGSTFALDYFKNLISFKESIEKMNLKPVIFYLEDTEDGSFYLSSETSAPNAPKILFKLDSDYTKLVENLQSAITTEPLQTELKNKLNDLLYIDLRYGNKVFYKFKSGVN